MTPHEFEPTPERPPGHSCRSCGMIATDPAFLAAHPNETFKSPDPKPINQTGITTEALRALDRIWEISSRSRLTPVSLSLTHIQTIAGQVLGYPIGAQIPEDQSDPQPERKPNEPDTPDELLDLLAGISSDPQVEGLSLSQKASTMALLHIAKALQQIAGELKPLNEHIVETLENLSDNVCEEASLLDEHISEAADAMGLALDSVCNAIHTSHGRTPTV